MEGSDIVVASSLVSRTGSGMQAWQDPRDVLRSDTSAVSLPFEDRVRLDDAEFRLGIERSRTHELSTLLLAVSTDARRLRETSSRMIGEYATRLEAQEDELFEKANTIAQLQIDINALGVQIGEYIELGSARIDEIFRLKSEANERVQELALLDARFEQYRVESRTELAAVLAAKEERDRQIAALESSLVEAQELCVFRAAVVAKVTRSLASYRLHATTEAVKRRLFAKALSRWRCASAYSTGHRAASMQIAKEAAAMTLQLTSQHSRAMQQAQEGHALETEQARRRLVRVRDSRDSIAYDWLRNRPLQLVSMLSAWKTAHIKWLSDRCAAQTSRLIALETEAEAAVLHRVADRKERAANQLCRLLVHRFSCSIRTRFNQWSVVCHRIRAGEQIRHVRAADAAAHQIICGNLQQLIAEAEQRSISQLADFERSLTEKDLIIASISSRYEEATRALGETAAAREELEAQLASEMEQTRGLRVEFADEQERRLNDEALLHGTIEELRMDSALLVAEAASREEDAAALRSEVRTLREELRSREDAEKTSRETALLAQALMEVEIAALRRTLSTATQTAQEKAIELDELRVLALTLKNEVRNQDAKNRSLEEELCRSRQSDSELQKIQPDVGLVELSDSRIDVDVVCKLLDDKDRRKVLLSTFAAIKSNSKDEYISRLQRLCPNLWRVSKLLEDVFPEFRQDRDIN